MTRLVAALWADESGFILTAELVLVGTIVILGLVAALICVRDAIGGELTDVANAFKNLDQSYYYSGMHGCRNKNGGFRSWTAGSRFLNNRVDGEAPVMDHAEAFCPPPGCGQQKMGVIETAPAPCTPPCPPQATCPPTAPCPQPMAVPGQHCPPNLSAPCPTLGQPCPPTTDAVPCPPVGPVLPAPNGQLVW